MIVEHQASLARTGMPLKDQRGRQPADTPAYNHAVIRFTRFDNLDRQVLKPAIANLVAGLEHSKGISVAVCVVAYATIAGPVVLTPTSPGLFGQHLCWRHGSQQQAPGSQQRGI